MKIIIYLICLIQFAVASKFKMRAREHYAVHRVKSDSLEGEYKGLSNTINLWWEKPYILYYGFALSPVLANFKDDETSPLGDKIDYYHLSFEVKYFPRNYLPEYLENIYIRPAVGMSLLKPDNSIEGAYGYNIYMGLGYEYPFKNFGLAFEMAYRYANLEDGIEVQSITPSIGFHFYEMF